MKAIDVMSTLRIDDITLQINDKKIDKAPLRFGPVKHELV